MGFGAFTGYIDLAQVILYVFWAFFFGVIWYLHRENKREGYPLESDRSPNVMVQGFPAIPPAKVFRLRNGSLYQAPPGNPEARKVALAAGAHPGAPAVPAGNPFVDGVGPAAWAERGDHPELTAEDTPRIVPLRAAPGFSIDERDPNPIGMTVLAADDVKVGTVREAWVDRSEPQLRYLEVERTGGGVLLLPIYFCRLHADRRVVHCKALLGAQFAGVPGTARPDVITALEEDKLLAYYGGGYLYAAPGRAEPLL